MKKREELYYELLQERGGCEGQAFKNHACVGGLDLHETIFSKGHFRHLKGKAREYFELDKRNCAIMCRTFHTEHGHTRDFKEWWLKYAERYGDVQAFIRDAPLKVKC